MKLARKVERACSDWYGTIEAPVREVVRALRNCGINTTSSCGHELWIECDSFDPSNEMRTIYNVLTELGYARFRMCAAWDVCPSLRCNRSLRIDLADHEAASIVRAAKKGRKP